jgi:hypothetical protein
MLPPLLLLPLPMMRNVWRPARLDSKLPSGRRAAAVLLLLLLPLLVVSKLRLLLALLQAETAPPRAARLVHASWCAAPNV